MNFTNSKKSRFYALIKQEFTVLKANNKGVNLKRKEVKKINALRSSYF